MGIGGMVDLPSKALFLLDAGYVLVPPFGVRLLGIIYYEYDMLPCLYGSSLDGCGRGWRWGGETGTVRDGSEGFLVVPAVGQVGFRAV